MNDSLKKYSFNELLKQGRIRIPKIQRDYAQGREIPKVNEIRKDFVHTLLLVVKGKRPATELDFVYGSNQNNAFEPLDGQQRLTTLFLLHWMLGVELDNKTPVFTYETRNTSHEFCEELVKHKAIDFIQEALSNVDSNKEIKDERNKKPESPSLIIKNRDWFKWEWRHDPTILSMLVMLDAIFKEMKDDWGMDLNICRNYLENITFHLLNLGEFGLSNELFIKMNARGKQLSDFDKLKSTLEEELQIQQKEVNKQRNVLASAEDEKNWRNLMDGAWIDFFWDKYSRETILNTESMSPGDRKIERLQAALKAELQFKKLLLRLIALQLFEDIALQFSEKKPEELAVAAYELNESKIDNLMLVYIDSLNTLRSNEQHEIDTTNTLTLNFKKLIEDINLLIYKDDNGLYNEISSLLPKISHIDANDKSLFDSFLEEKVPNDVELTFYAMLLFLRTFPAQKLSWNFDKNAHASWLKNFEDWVRFTRNVLLNDNNNQRIDKIEKSLDATQSLKNMVGDLADFVKNQGLDVEKDKSIIKKFLKSSNNKYQGLDTRSLEEEREKARLILDDSAAWEPCLDTVEQHWYLWGQVRCLLKWSGNKLDLFKRYSDKLLQLLKYIDKDPKKNILTFYSAMLVSTPYYWKDRKCLFLYNKDRDLGLKRYLRDKDTYESDIKVLLDVWIEKYASLNAVEFLKSFVASKKTHIEQWIQCVLEYPFLLDKAGFKTIYNQNGHVVLAQKKTENSHCFDIILVYLENYCKHQAIEESKYKFYDSKSDYPHAFEFIDNTNTTYLVTWAKEEQGKYSIQKGETLLNECSAEELLQFMKEIIDKDTL